MADAAYLTINPVATVLTFRPKVIPIAVEPWLSKVLKDAQTIARQEANKDTGIMAAGIDFAVVRGSGDTDMTGILYATESYALWQELEPGDRVPGGGTRRRAGGKSFLRPGVFRALNEAL